MRKPPRCFSRSGWWQTLCGKDSANQGYGWSDRKRDVGCPECLRLIRKGEHRRWKSQHILFEQRNGALYIGDRGVMKRYVDRRPHA